MAPSMTTRWRVDGRDITPEGYRDDLLYLGDSAWQAFKAWRAARREGMEVSLTRAGDVGIVYPDNGG